MLWWYRYQHVYVVGQQMPLLHLTFLRPRQYSKHVPELLAKSPEKHLPSIFRYEPHVEIAFPYALAQRSVVVHLNSFRVAWAAHDLEFTGRLLELSNSESLPGTAGGDLQLALEIKT